MDILSGSWPGEVYFFRRNANGTYAEPEKLKDRTGKTIQAGRASAVAFADWDSDGDLDLFLGNIEGAVNYIANEGSARKPRFGEAQPLKADGAAIKVGGGDAGPALADWDGDGQLDLLAGTGSGAVLLYKGKGGKEIPEFASAVTLIEEHPKDRGGKEPARSCARAKIDVADWNDDGLKDLLVGDFTGGSGNYHGWVWVYLREPLEVSGQ